MPQRFGDFATWTGSIGTVAAFAVAYYQIHQERRHRLARELKDRVAARREHADRVSAWVSGSQVVVANRSGHPIHDVDIALGTLRPGGTVDESSRDSSSGGVGDSGSSGADEDSGAAVEPASSVHSVVIPPGEHAIPLDDADTEPHVVQVWFTDSRADRWSRKAGKHPERVVAVD